MQSGNTRAIVYAGLVAAAYVVITYAFSPISFGPLQFRVSTLILPVVLLDRKMALGLAVGVGLSNIISPFGWYDWLIMPIACYGIYTLGYSMRSQPYISLTVMSALIATAVSFFPLHFGGNIPIWPTIAVIFVSTLISALFGWLIIWRNMKRYVGNGTQGIKG